MKVTVVDSIMGSGKTSYFIDKMNKDNSRYVYITPFLSEIKRVKNAITDKQFYDPENKGKGKLNSFNSLLSKKYCVISTHELFKTADELTKSLISDGEYTLVLDEVMDVIDYYNITKDDITMLINSGYMRVREDGFVEWLKDDYKTNNQDFKDLKLMAENERVMMHNDHLLLWCFPVDVFKSFKEVFILTYKFNGQIMRAYYDLYNIEYKFVSVRKFDNQYKIVEYIDDKAKIQDLIEVVNDLKLNAIGNDRYSLSATWYKKAKDDPTSGTLKIIQNNMYNFFKNKCKATSNDVIWTSFKGVGKDLEDNSKQTSLIKNKVKPKSYASDSCFAPVNSRATNDYADRHYLAYPVNVFMNPYLSSFFKNKGIDVNEDEYSLSTLLQWVFRSAVRNNENVKIYIPSSRMRLLLLRWIVQEVENKDPKILIEYEEWETMMWEDAINYCGLENIVDSEDDSWGYSKIK